MATNVSKSSNIWMWIAIVGGCLAVTILAFVFIVEAPPPNRIVIATGGTDGAYYRYGQKYAELLKKDGITLEVRATRGSVENVNLLLDDNSDVTVAFVQGGITEPSNADSLQSLGSLYREPLWIFHRSAEPMDRLTQLAGMRVAIGPEGSGTRAIASQLLEANGLDLTQSEFVGLSGKDAAEALVRDEIDVAFIVSGIDAAHIQRLIREPQIQLLSLSHAEAYSRRFRFLSPVTIPAGLLDLQRNLPESDAVLVAPAATLVSTKSLHPALISLLLKAATKVHHDGDLLTNAGEFPSAALVDLPLSEDAERYFRSGPPVLQRILPFWLASLVDRMKLMVIPLVMLLTPLLRAAPPLVRWRTRRRIYLSYTQLKAIDQLSIQGISVDDAKSLLERLMVLEPQVAQVGVPLSYMEEYYNLRLHLNLVRSRVEATLRTAQMSPSEGYRGKDEKISTAA